MTDLNRNLELFSVRNRISTAIYETNQYFDIEYAKEIEVLTLVKKFQSLPETTNQKEILQRRMLMIQMLREIDAFNNLKFPEMSQMGVDELISAYTEIYTQGVQRKDKLIVAYDYLLEQVYV